MARNIIPLAAGRMMAPHALSGPRYGARPPVPSKLSREVARLKAEHVRLAAEHRQLKASLEIAELQAECVRLKDERRRLRTELKAAEAKQRERESQAKGLTLAVGPTFARIAAGIKMPS